MRVFGIVYVFILYPAVLLNYYFSSVTHLCVCIFFGISRVFVYIYIYIRKFVFFSFSGLGNSCTAFIFECLLFLCLASIALA